MELSRGRNVASNSLLRLEEMYEDSTFMKKLHAQLSLVKVKGPTLLKYLNYFQEKVPHVTQVHEKMGRLLHFLSVNAAGTAEDFSFCFEGNHKFSSKEKAEHVKIATSAFEAAHSKLSKYMVDGAQPASKFLEQVRVLDPINLVDCERSLGLIDSIPGIESVSDEEWNLYVDHIGPQAVKSIKDEDELDLKQFWKSKANSLPELYKLASCYYTTTIGSYDVERSFSAYIAILDGKRRSLEENTMKAFHFLNWNLRVKSAVQVEQQVQEARNAVPQDKSRKRSATTPMNDVAPKRAKKEGDSKACATTTTDSALQDESSPRKDENVQVMDEGVQDKSGIPPQKARKQSMMSTTGNGNDVPTKSKKKGNESGGKLFRSSIKDLLSATAVNDKKDRDSTPKVSQQDSEPVVNYGLDQNIASKFNIPETTCCFPEHKQPLLDCLLDGTIKVNGNNIVDVKDLEALLGGQTREEDNYLNNFVIDWYLNILAKSVSTESKVECIEWEKFEKGIGTGKPTATKKALKEKASILAQDVVLVPCNPGGSKHWFLLLVLPVEKKIVALDSLAGAFIKPTVERAIRKMWGLLKSECP